MVDLNLVVLSGRLAAPPDLRAFDGGSRLLRYLLTVRSEHPRRVDVLPVTLWNPSSERLDEDPVAGTRIWVAASIQRRFWDAVEGRRSRLEVVADQVSIRRPEGCDEDEPVRMLEWPTPG
jgi:single-strand DNA-binding protein